MRYEIGSHFEFDHNIKEKDRRNESWLPSFCDSQFTFSGRSAIELVIKDIGKSKKVNNVYMPSYCCDSMIIPFIKNNINVKFYKVKYSEEYGLTYDINTDVECDIFFTMSYFGLEEYKLENAMSKFTERGVTIVEDITHSLLCEKPYSILSHYCIASLRKWLSIPTGGYVTKKNGFFYEKPFISSDNLIEQQIEAMYEKSRYLNGDNVNKEAFLTKFANLEQKLSDLNYKYKIDNTSYNIINNTNIEEVRVKRQNNARILYEGISDCHNLKPLISNPDISIKCPLFVPVIVKEGKRDDLRKYLIEHKMYFPIHWPIPQLDVKLSDDTLNIYSNQLSIVCDQRYTLDDMKRVIIKINDFFERKIS